MYQSDSAVTLVSTGPGQEVKCESYGDETLVIRSPVKPAEEAHSISFATSYCTEWEKLFQKPDFLKPLREYGIEGKLRSCRFRSVCWKVYVEVLPDDTTQWLEKTQEWRDRYDQLKDSLIVNPRNSEEVQDANVKLNNPLSQADESPWNRFFQDNELRLTIKQDVIRTYPRIEFFHTSEIHSMMVDILFVYAKVKPDVSYRQGMHELLAPLIFVLHCDHQAFLHACEIEQVGNVLENVLNPAFIEHDAFAMFCQIMETAEHWYVSKELSPTVRPKNILKSQPFARPQDMNPSNVIVNKLTRIQDYLLKRYDPELHLYLERMEIPPQIYGIRWVRLLFGREFPMQDLLVVWDAVFADSISFDLVDYIFLAMLLYLRDALLSSDYPTCLHFLMKYPPVGDINYFIQKARFLRDPNDHYCPPHYTYQKPANFIHSSYGDVFQGMNGLPNIKQTITNNRGGTKIAEKASSFMSSGFASLTRRFGSQQKARRQMSLPGSGSSTLNKKTSQSAATLNDRPSPSSDILPTSSYFTPNHSRKGSSASMSQLEDQIPPYSGLRGGSASHNVSRTDMWRVGSEQSLDEGEYMHMEHRMSGSLHRKGSGMSNGGGNRGFTGKRNVSHTARNADLEQRISFLLGRLNDLENMCNKCSDKMDMHIDKLQTEMLRKQLENEDELLLALAGLKVVKDVLKGELKPTALSFDDEISIRDNHYREESPAVIRLHPQVSGDSVDSSYKVDLSGVGTHSNSPDLSSEAELTSPEEPAAYMHTPQDEVNYLPEEDISQEIPRTPSSILRQDLLKQKEVEMSSFENINKFPPQINSQRQNLRQERGQYGSYSDEPPEKYSSRTEQQFFGGSNVGPNNGIPDNNASRVNRGDVNQNSKSNGTRERIY